MTRNHTFTGLDAFRGLVAMTVCLHHSRSYWGIAFPETTETVDLFFLVGGFVVAHSYERRLLEGRISFRDFVLIRLIRLYPLYLIGLLLISVPVIAAMFLNHDRPDNIIMQYVWAAVLGILMLPMKTADSSWCYPLNIVYWSLFWALTTNLIYAGLIHRLTDRVLFAAVVVTAVLLAVCVFHHGSIDLGSRWGPLSIFGGLLRAVFGMALGVLLFRHYNAVPRWMVGRGGYLLPLALITLVLWGPSIGAKDWLLQLFAVFVVFPWSVVRAVRGPQPAGHKMLQAVGFVSYPIYVLHVPLAQMMDTITSRRLAEFAPVGGMVMVVILVGLAMVADRWVDRPFRSWLTAKVFDRTTVAIPALSVGS